MENCARRPSWAKSRSQPRAMKTRRVLMGEKCERILGMVNRICRSSRRNQRQKRNKRLSLLLLYRVATTRIQLHRPARILRGPGEGCVDAHPKRKKATVLTGAFLLSPKTTYSFTGEHSSFSRCSL